MSRLIPPGATESWVDSSVGRLRMLTAGVPGTETALPVVLIHGGGNDNSAISWYRLMEPLGEQHRVFAIDLPGFGGSVDREPVGGPGPLADLVHEVMGRLELPPAVVVGGSMGGDVALHLALDHPTAIAGLVLVAPGGLVRVIRNRAVQFSAWLAAQLPDRILFALGRQANRFVDRALRAIVKDLATLPTEVVREFVSEDAHPRSGLGYGRYNQATLGPGRMRNDVSDVVWRITVPTLFFHGADDPMVDPKGSAMAAARMPSARLVAVPNCGHWAQLEQHALFLKELQAFLARIDAEAPVSADKDRAAPSADASTVLPKG